jgi:hypothetical protein
MPPDGKLRAWIEVRHDQVLAAFVGVTAAGNTRASRPPATRLCASPDDAKRWVEDEAKAFGLPIEWVGAIHT